MSIDVDKFRALDTESSVKDSLLDGKHEESNGHGEMLELVDKHHCSGGEHVQNGLILSELQVVTDMIKETVFNNP